MGKFLLLFTSFILAQSAFAFAPFDILSIPGIEREWNSSENFLNTKVLKLTNKNLSNRIPLTLAIFKDSGWTLSEVEGKLQRTAEIYRTQCGINFDPVLILETESIGGATVNFDNPWSHIIFPNLEISKALLKPLIYFAKNEIKDTGRGGWSWPRSSDIGRKFAELRNSAMLFRNIALDKNFSVGFESPQTQGRYEILAHELAHVLMDSEHTPALGDIMSKLKYRTNKILTTQCEKIQANFL